MLPRFNQGFSSYTNKREFTLTSISGWEKKHYTPDAPDLFGIEKDCFVYTSADKKYMFTVTVDRDEVNLSVYYREKTAKDTHGGYIPEDCKVANAIHSDLLLNQTKKPGIHLVENPPHIADLQYNAFYLVRAKNKLTLYFADADQRLYTKINPRSTDCDDFYTNVNLLESALDARDDEKAAEFLGLVKSKSDISHKTFKWDPFLTSFNKADSTILVEFQSRNEVSGYQELLEGLDIFKKHLDIHDEIINDLASIISNKKNNILQDRLSLADKIVNEPEAVQKQLGQVLYPFAMHSEYHGEYALDLVRWFYSNDNPEIAIFLCMGFPLGNDLYLKAYERAKYLILDAVFEDDKKEYYMKMLLSVAFRIALVSNKKDDIIYAMNLTKELEFKNAFEKVELEKMDPHSLAELLISKTLEIRQLKQNPRGAAQLAIEGNPSQSTAVSGAARLTLAQDLKREALQKAANRTSKAGLGIITPKSERHCI